jgi:hypothetical protein
MINKDKLRLQLIQQNKTIIRKLFYLLLYCFSHTLHILYNIFLQIFFTLVHLSTASYKLMSNILNIQYMETNNSKSLKTMGICNFR